MKLTKEQKPTVETVPSVDVELNEEQLEIIAGGVWGGIDGGGCTPTFPWETKNMPDVIVPKVPDVIETIG